MTTIYGDRIRQARLIRGITQAELAESVGVAQPAIAQIERGLTQPTPYHLSAIALRTGFPLAFFRKAPAADLPLGSLLYRARASVKARDRDFAHAYARLLCEAVDRLARRVRGLRLRLPRLDMPAEEAARITRAELGLAPDTPIPHLLHVVERAGVYVVALPRVIEGIEAFAAWWGTDPAHPIVALGQSNAGDRQRLTLAHEVGHLVLTPEGNLQDIERKAYAFGAELLLPASAMREELVPPVTLTSLATLKIRWRVSIQALIRRARDLAIISQRQYTYLFEQLSARGWRTQEPANLTIPVEKPRAFRKMVEVLYGSDPDLPRLADDLALPLKDVVTMIDAYATPAELPPKGVAEHRQTKVLAFPARRLDE